MRILATAIVIAIAVTSAGCSASSSSSSRAPAQTATQTNAAPTQSVAGPAKTAAGATKATPGSKTVVAQVVGRPLDVAEGMLHNAGISYKVITLHGQLNGAATRWGVCETKLARMTERSSVVDLVVAQLRCGGH